MLNAGELRHRVNIQRQVTSNAGGVLTHTWQDEVTNEPAKVEAMSARELIAAQSQNSQVSARVVLRYRAGITAKHRIVHGERIYNIHGVIPDPDSGVEYLTLPVSEGTNDGS